jgi:putative AbiEii toxin of type IV toxin-antitoxin system/OLD-like protein
MTTDPQTPSSYPDEHITKLAPPSVTFKSMEFSDGTVIELQSDDIVLFVGPNNAGKSAALRDIEWHVGPKTNGKVVKAAELLRSGTLEDYREFMTSVSRLDGDARDHRNRQYRGYGYQVPATHLDHSWVTDLAIVRSLFCLRIPTETRITASNPVTALSVLENPPSHPIHMLFIDDRIETRLSGYFREGFGVDLILFRGGGGSWPLLVGHRPDFRDGEDRISMSYIARLKAETTPLQEQGDGMRSFASVILHMLAPDTPSILLLDEPEAFLHPPQARLLGEFIAKERPSRAQLFIATHSSDVLQGLLNVSPDRLRIIRLQREGEVNRVKELDKVHTKALTNDPVMKFTSVLSGIFHQRVIICESDADCMFYSAILDLPSVRGTRYPDVLFVHAGGKHRMAVLAEALRALDVHVDVIADFDILNDEGNLERLVKALGGQWDSIRPDASALKAAVEQRKPWLNANEVAKGISEIINRAPATGEFPKPLRREIDAIFRKASPWDAIKEAGRAAVPSGQTTKHYEDLQAHCNAFGLWIVPVGELEGFCKSEGGHGPAWVQHVIEEHDLAAADALNAARDFVRAVWNRVPS